jgi:hypothetical protein
MNDYVAWIAAEADLPGQAKEGVPARRVKSESASNPEISLQGLVAHQVPARLVTPESTEIPSLAENAKDGAASESVEPSTDECLIPAELESAAETEYRNFQEDRERRVYRGRTVAMLRKYLRYSIETGRLPSVLGGESFRAKMTTYSVVTFEDRVIFVHDMEKCLGRLDEFSRQLIARHILQEHDQEATGKLLHCTERTVRTYVPVVLDLFSQILVEVGMLERLDSNSEKSCQGGKTGPFSVSDCEEGKYKF